MDMGWKMNRKVMVAWRTSSPGSRRKAQQQQQTATATTLSMPKVMSNYAKGDVQHDSA
jgi:hypothetical protein